MNKKPGSISYYKKRNALVYKKRKAGMTLDELASEFQVTRERIRQIVIKIKARERHELLKKYNMIIQSWYDMKETAGRQYSRDGVIYSTPTIQEIMLNIDFWQDQVKRLRNTKRTSKVM